MKMSTPEEGKAKPDLTRLDSKGNNKKKGKFRGQQNRYVSPKFKGETKALHGFIYDVGTMNQANLFTEKTKKVASFAGQTLKEPQDI